MSFYRMFASTIDIHVAETHILDLHRCDLNTHHTAKDVR